MVHALGGAAMAFCLSQIDLADTMSDLAFGMIGALAFLLYARVRART